MSSIGEAAMYYREAGEQLQEAAVVTHSVADQVETHCADLETTRDKLTAVRGVVAGLVKRPEFHEEHNPPGVYNAVSNGITKHNAVHTPFRQRGAFEADRLASMPSSAGGTIGERMRAYIGLEQEMQTHGVGDSMGALQQLLGEVIRMSESARVELGGVASDTRSLVDEIAGTAQQARDTADGL